MHGTSIVLQRIGIVAASGGSLGFVAGFFGPIVFAPAANQGPLLGIFVTGPWSAVLSSVLGAFVDCTKAGKG
jgi:hypothetical protein